MGRLDFHRLQHRSRPTCVDTPPSYPMGAPQTHAAKTARFTPPREKVYAPCKTAPRQVRRKETRALSLCLKREFRYDRAAGVIASNPSAKYYHYIHILGLSRGSEHLRTRVLVKGVRPSHQTTSERQRWMCVPTVVNLARCSARIGRRAGGGLGSGLTKSQICRCRSRGASGTSTAQYSSARGSGKGCPLRGQPVTNVHERYQYNGCENQGLWALG